MDGFRKGATVREYKEARRELAKQVLKLLADHNLSHGQARDVLYTVTDLKGNSRLVVDDPQP